MVAAVGAAPADRSRPVLHVLQVDPSLFTAPYDAALADGLAANGVMTRWAARNPREAEEDPLADRRLPSVFYPWSDNGRRRDGPAWRIVKGVEHAAGLMRLGRTVAAGNFDLVHFQWAPVPALDLLAMAAIRAARPVVMTVHDIRPFNGRPVHFFQRHGVDRLFRNVDHLIVHSEAGFSALRAQGVPEGRISIVPHGLLPLPDVRPEPRPDDGRWRVLLFGRLQPYKGADLLVEALGRLPEEVRERLDVVVAGEAQMPLAQLRSRAETLGLGRAFTLREGRLEDRAMAALLRSADAFVFPYRSIDASGVFHLVADLDRWLIASDLAVFRDVIGDDGRAGALIPPDDVDALGAALAAGIGRRPVARPATGVPSWTKIGAQTRAIYEQLIATRAGLQVA